MAHWITVWRAAQLVGVPRGVLQRRVRSGEIELADGLVSTDTLLRLYPQVRLEETGILERVVQIRDDSFAKRLRERILPSQEVLAQRLFRQSQELADVQRHLQRYHTLVVSLHDRIRELRASPAGDGGLALLQRQLEEGLARVLATEPVDVLDVMDDMLKVVSAQVTVRPSGRQFAVEGHDTLLQAGLRSGLKLNYGCGNGTCGMCKVRVTSGQVIRTMPTDYPLSENEKAQGYVLSCACTAASSEVTIETLEASGPQDIPQQQIVANVRAVKSLAPDTRLLHLQTPRTYRLRFLAGQWVTLGSALDGGRADYPIASCPCDDRNLHFYVKRDSADAFSRRLFADEVRPGEAITLWGPSGGFVLHDSTLPLVFVACDTGFAPIKSLIEHAMSLDSAPSIHLFWLATRPDGHFMDNLCRSWSEALDEFEYSPHRDGDPAQGASTLAATLRADLFDVDCCYYVAGPETFVVSMRKQLLTIGVPTANQHFEVTP